MWGMRICFVMIFYSVLEARCYDTPSNPQYHIQTDEGPERYFRYQTLSGQFRKEKRLEDGTVIGSYAWIDDDGMLRQRDYIADKAGYRITKSKNLYVGKNMPVGEAVKAAKKFPASAGTLVSSKARPVPSTRTSPIAVPVSVTTIAPPVTTSLPTVSTTAIPCASCGITPTTYKPDVSYFESTPLSPHVEISNNALPSSTVLPPFSSTEAPYVQISQGPLYSTPAYYSTGAGAVNGLQYDSSTISPYDNLPSYNEADQNSLDYNPYVNPANRGVLFQNGPTYPIDRNGHTYRGNKRFSDPRIGNGYDKQYPEYDGVSVTNDGFRYYIPRAYHEEQTGVANEKTGSFGYIDPFGIRRVIYYNAKPGEGFQHRKNNRYVGFDATPYDPRPY